MREITCVSLDITTACDRACPDCCCNIHSGERTPIHHNWAYFERAASFIYGIERVHCTGGEPTLHPRFAEFVPKFKALFGCRLLTLQTDGRGVQKHWAVMHQFDHIYMSRYDERNAAVADLVQISFPSTKWSGDFTPR